MADDGTGAPPELPAGLGGLVATDAPDPLIGTTLMSRYHIERKLGEGGMGSVYAARHVSLGKPVALKVLHQEFTRKRDLVERFLQEARAASRIRHENVIDITDFGTTPEGLVFFAMEFLEGVELHDVLARARLEGAVIPWSRSKGIFLQVCAALTAAHRQGIVHRDLKPENIFLIDRDDERDFVKLLDFGIAKVSELGDGERRLTRTGMIFGTPEYMSPEQARGEQVDHRVDVYAMGCILYQLITGHVPFEAETFMGVLSKHMSDPPPALGGTLEEVGAPRALNDIVQIALAKDREQRFQSVEAFAQAVKEADRTAAPTAVRPVEASADTAQDSSEPVPRRRPTTRTRTRWTGSARLVEAEESVEDAPAVQGGRSRARRWALLGGVVVVAAAAGTYAIVGRGGGATPAAPTDAGPSGEVAPAAPDRAPGADSPAIDAGAAASESNGQVGVNGRGRGPRVDHDPDPGTRDRERGTPAVDAGRGRDELVTPAEFEQTCQGDDCPGRDRPGAEDPPTDNSGEGDLELIPGHEIPGLGASE